MRFTDHELDDAALDALCRHWKITALEVFGSTARGTARPDSDLDLLATFEPDADWGLLDHATMEAELTELLGRNVDLVTRRAVERNHNPIRRRAILADAVPFYVAR